MINPLKRLPCLFLLLFVLNSACERETHTFLVTQDTKDYFDFPEGSYWVYVNDSMGFVDTLTLQDR